ncbi:helix-turn-helix domain-containing protein [Gloeothece verrucosa]|nr:helix-turn-helix domain-containing protein [Gloeothece verrucosa]
MKKKSHLPIKETPEELKNLLKTVKNKEQLEKIQALYWLQTEQFFTVVDIAQALGKNRSTIHRWFNEYSQKGLEFWLNKPKKTSGRKAIISENIQKKLLKKFLEKDKKINYKEIQLWLEKTYGIKVSYSVVYKTVKTLLPHH